MQRGSAARPVRGAVPWLPVAMVLALVTVFAMALLDEQREQAAALDDFAREQAVLARSVAGQLRSRLLLLRREAALARPLPAPVLGEIIAGVAEIERPADLIALVLPPAAAEFHTTDGRIVAQDTIARALGGGQTSVRLGRAEAASLGLPPRTAWAGLARIDAGSLGRWGIATVASAERERDRERRASWRLGLGVALATGLVLLFGGVAMRNQRKELDLTRELTVADLERRRDEQLVRASRVATMGTLAMGVAHEISTPLSVIAGRAEQLLARAAGDERAARGAQAILDETERISQVIRGFLGIARGGDPPRERIEARQVVDAAVGLCEHRFVKAGVALRTDVAQPLPLLYGDRRLLEHALVNLLLNACDACQGQGAVTVELRREAGRLAFCVADDGTGIPAAIAERALEPFFTTKPFGEGTGLGLAIVHEIVKGHRGELSLRPRSPRGTLACFLIPLPDEAAT
jgi:signal transduction histidine kinase